QADIDEGRLHAGQDVLHPALVDVADDALRQRPLDEHVHQAAVLQDGAARLVVFHRDEDLLFQYLSTPWTRRGTRRRRRIPSGGAHLSRSISFLIITVPRGAGESHAHDASRSSRVASKRPSRAACTSLASLSRP